MVLCLKEGGEQPSRSRLIGFGSSPITARIARACEADSASIDWTWFVLWPCLFSSLAQIDRQCVTELIGG